MPDRDQRIAARVAAEVAAQKADLRARLRRRRQSLGPAVQRQAARSLLQHVPALPGWPQARRVAFYIAADGEIDPATLARSARDESRLLYLPVITREQRLVFAAWEKADHLHTNRYGIPEPSPEAPRCPVSDLDVLFMPLVGWDLSGGRLGMGGGFYDRTLAGIEGPLLVGLAHSRQQVGHVPRNDWDVRLDFVATESALHDCRVLRE